MPDNVSRSLWSHYGMLRGYRHPGRRQVSPPAPSCPATGGTGVQLHHPQGPSMAGGDIWGVSHIPSQPRGGGNAWPFVRVPLPLSDSEAKGDKAPHPMSAGDVGAGDFPRVWRSTDGARGQSLGRFPAGAAVPTLFVIIIKPNSSGFLPELIREEELWLICSI